MTTCKQCFVPGWVPGVFYRDSTRQQAENFNSQGMQKIYPMVGSKLLFVAQKQVLNNYLSGYGRGLNIHLFLM